MEGLNPVPKPNYKKQKRAVNNSRPTAEDYCTVCGKPYAHNHEVFFGTGERQISIEWGLQERLCYQHHNKPGGMNPHFNKAIDTILKQKHQRAFEEKYGHELFMELIGQNYL